MSGALDNRLAAALDRDDALALLRGSIGCESITGNEASFAAFLAGEMQRRGVEDVRTAEFLPGRPNVWGERRGAGGGPRLLFVGHTDTVHVDGWREHWHGTEREDPFAAPVVDGAVWGRGAGDLKAGICCQPCRLGVLDRAGVRLRRRRWLCLRRRRGERPAGHRRFRRGARVSSPRSRPARSRGPTSSSTSSRRGSTSTRRRWASSSADITVIGQSAYFGVPELGRDALKAAHRSSPRSGRIRTP